MFSSLAALAGLEIKAATQRGVRVAGLLVLTLIFTLAAVFYAMAAFGEWLRLRYAPVDVQLILAGCALLVAILLGTGAYILRRAPLDRTASKQTMALVAAPFAMNLARRGLPGLGRVLPLVVLGGFLLGRFGKESR